MLIKGVMVAPYPGNLRIFLMQRVEDAVRNNKQVKMIAYSVSPIIEERMKMIIKVFLVHRGCEVLQDALYTAVKELLINAIKANFKNVFFENYNTKNKAESVIDYQTSLKLFRLEMNREGARYLSRLSKLRSLKAEILFRIKDDDFLIDIMNPAPMTEIEMENVSRKLEYAARCEDIIEYFDMDDEDPNQEGAGLGLILISMILKSLGIGPEGFRIGCDGVTTVASLAIPLREHTLANYRKHVNAR